MNNINIFVDADACPVNDIIVKVAKDFNIPVFMFVDTSHVLHSDYAQIVIVDKSADSVDFAIINRIKKGDIAVTQDYGLASMILAKGAYPIHQNGFLYTSENIDKLLFERHMAKKLRRAKVRIHNHIKSRTKQNDIKFESCLCNLCKKLCNL